MPRTHHYQATTRWTGNRGTGTNTYTAYDRSYEIAVPGKVPIHGSSDPAFRGDRSKHNPEDLLVMSLSSCHMLWYLHLCAEHGVIVTDYADEATGTMAEDSNGSGQFTEITLKPRVTVTETAMIAKANALHHQANEMCFIARSMKFPVNHKPETIALSGS
jgi:organic hydroperoxide reductase OsmC/OhrA